MALQWFYVDIILLIKQYYYSYLHKNSTKHSFLHL